MWFTTILSAITAPVTAWVEGSEKRKALTIENEAKAADRLHETNIKKLDIGFKLAEAGMKVEANWDTTAQNNMKYTWKDEWFVILFSIPLIGAFIPDMASHVLTGFAILDKTPEWYRWLLAGIVVATFGLRWMFSKIKM